jgi:hypothetical protein
MRKLTRSICNVVLPGALLLGLTTVPTMLRAEDHKYHDEKNNDDHDWNNHEDRAYRIWVKENHRKYETFERIREEDRQRYWVWRHEHPDTVLKIDVR